jgi:hypothetical protein
MVTTSCDETIHPKLHTEAVHLLFVTASSLATASRRPLCTICITNSSPQRHNKPRTTTMIHAVFNLDIKVVFVKQLLVRAQDLCDRESSIKVLRCTSRRAPRL